MKTKAPEKIYLWESELCGHEYDDEWFDRPLNGDSVEYTRTDAFIEKALTFIKENVDKYAYRTFDIAKGFEVTDISEYFDDDFKQYMEG